MKRYLMLGILSISVVLAGFAGAAQGPGGRWELLGRQEVAFRGDHDRIEVGRQEGRFRQLQIRVEGAPIEMRRMVVTFRNRETFNPTLRHRFDKNSRSRVIDLPGNRRVIESIDFDYRSISRQEGIATVAVYGR